MEQSALKFDSLIPQIMASLRDIGITEQSLWCSYYGAYHSIRAFHARNGTEIYSVQLMLCYEDEIREKYRSTQISRGYCGILLKASERMQEFVLTGRLEWNRRAKGTQNKLNEENEQFLCDFAASISVASSTAGDIVWALRKYLSFMEKRGRATDEISTGDLREFLVFCSGTLKINSIYNVRCYVKKFHQFLEAGGAPTLSKSLLMSAPIVRPKRIWPGLTPDEFQRIMEQIDTFTPQGKRDFAIFTLAAATGLRGEDIVNLKLRDIDWSVGQIRLIQEKTKESLRLPLTHDAGNAVQTYILHARPKSDSEYVFLLARAPYRKIKNSMALNYLIRSYEQKAGMEYQAYDGKGFHAIRRMVAKSMALGGVPVDTIAQILGHNGLDTVKQYIALDSEQLKICALDFRGIEPAGEGQIQ